MLTKTFRLLRLALTPGIYRAPLTMKRELKKRGIKRGSRSEENHSKDISRFRWLRHAFRAENITRHNGKWVLNSFMPPFPSRAYDRMFEAMYSGRRLSPVSAFLAITADCDYSCPHCSAKLRKTANLKTADWARTVDSLLELGTAVIGFTGGEPMTRNDLPELIKRTSEGGAATILFTTGSKFDEITAKQLADAGLWAVCFSLDDTNESKFNEFRGNPNAFQSVKNAVAIAKKYSFYTMLGSVATPEFVNNREYEKLHKLAETWNVDELRIVETMPCGLLRSAGEAHFLNLEQIRIIRDFHCETNTRNPKTKICAFNEIESPENFGCGGGTQHLYIDSAGEVCPCDFTPLSFGNITRLPLPEIWEKMNDAMGEPRRHCFIRKNHALIQEAFTLTNEYPLCPEHSCEVCREAGPEDLPDYFQITTGRKRKEK